MRLALAAAVAALSACEPAYAQRAVACAPLDRLLTSLAENHGERLSHEAVTADGDLLLIAVAPDGAWTLLVARPSGLASGQGWQPVPPAVPGKPS